jgi:hypothetical protein
MEQWLRCAGALAQVRLDAAQREDHAAASGQQRAGVDNAQENEMTKYTINELANSKGVSQHVREALLQMEAELEATNRQVEILSDTLVVSQRNVEAMIALARADEREACAKVCDDMVLYTGYDCAAAIRARGNK